MMVEAGGTEAGGSVDPRIEAVIAALAAEIGFNDREECVALAVAVLAAIDAISDPQSGRIVSAEGTVDDYLSRAVEIRNKLYYGSGRFRASAEGEALVNELGGVLASLALAIEDSQSGRGEKP